MSLGETIPNDPAAASIPAGTVANPATTESPAVRARALSGTPRRTLKLKPTGLSLSAAPPRAACGAQPATHRLDDESVRTRRHEDSKTRRLEDSKTRRLEDSKARRLNHSTTQPLNHSTTQPLDHSKTHHPVPNRAYPTPSLLLPFSFPLLFSPPLPAYHIIKTDTSSRTCSIPPPAKWSPVQPAARPPCERQECPERPWAPSPRAHPH